MLSQVDPVDALWLVSVSASVLDFVSAFRRYADRQGIFIPTSEPLTAGKRGRIAITLADGQIMIEGDAEVVNSTARPGGLHGRAGMTLRFSDLDEDSKLVIAQLEKARFATKVTTVPDNIRARPARMPAGTPTPTINPDEKIIDPAQALALCIIVGNRDALSDSSSRPRSITDAPSAAVKAIAGPGSGKFVMPSIPSPGGTGRIAVVPSASKTAGETGPTPTPRVGSSTSPPPFGQTAAPASVATAVAPASSPNTAPASSPSTSPASSPSTSAVALGKTSLSGAVVIPSTSGTAPAMASDELDMDDLVAIDEAKSTEEMITAPTVTVLSPVIVPAREPANTPPKLPARRANPAANLTLRTAAVPAPIHSVSPFLQSDTSPSSVVDESEITSTSEIPLSPSDAVQHQSRPVSAVFAAPEPTFVGMVTPGGRATTADDLAETTSNSAAPTNDATFTSASSPVSNAAQAAPQDQAEQVLVTAEIAPGASAGRRHDELNPVTGNWTIALTPAGPATVVREPLAPQFAIAPSLRVGNAPLEISGAVGGRTDQTAAHRPVGAAPSVEISAELSQPDSHTARAQSLQNMVARMPPSGPPVGDAVAIASKLAPPSPKVDPYGATSAYQFGDLGQVEGLGPGQAAPVGAGDIRPQFVKPAQELASHAFAAHPVAHDSRAVTDGGTGFFQSEDSAANRPRYQTTGANVIIPAPRSRRVWFIAAGAVALLAIVIIVIMAMGGSSSNKTASPPGGAGSANAHGSDTDNAKLGTTVGSSGSANTVAVDAPMAASIDAGEALPSDAPAVMVASVDAAIDEIVPASTLCTLKLNSEPMGAEVVNDKDVLGITPFSIDVACDQPLVLKFRKAKWIGISKTLKPNRKGVSFTAHLLKPALSIRVISTPPGATVSVNGKVAGVTPATIKTTVGVAATIAVAKKGFVTAIKKHTAKANNELVNFVLTKTKSR